MLQNNLAEGTPSWGCDDYQTPSAHAFAQMRALRAVLQAKAQLATPAT
jgi:hypothetical protein